MKTKIIPLVTSMITLACANAYAGGNGSPIFYGNLDAGVIKHQSKSDVSGEAFEVSAGVKGVYKFDGYKIIYNLETEMTKATNARSGESDFEIKNAYIVVPSAYGTLILGPQVESGQQKEMYKVVDIFQTNEAHGNTVSPVWGQRDEVSGMVGYNTPKVGGFYGAIRFLTLEDDNEKDVDAFGARIIYKKDKLYLGLGFVTIASEVLPTSENYERTTFTAGYSFANVDAGFTYEKNEDSPSGDFDVWAVAADMMINEQWSAGLSYIDKDHDVDALDNDGVIGIVRRKLNDDIFVYAEVAAYSLDDMDNYTIGININF